MVASVTRCITPHPTLLPTWKDDPAIHPVLRFQIGQNPLQTSFYTSEPHNTSIPHDTSIQTSFQATNKENKLSGHYHTHIWISREVCEGVLTLPFIWTKRQSPRIISQDDAPGVGCGYYCQQETRTQLTGRGYCVLEWDGATFKNLRRGRNSNHGSLEPARIQSNSLDVLCITL